MHFFLPLGHSVRVFIVSRGILDSVPWSSHDNNDTVAHKQVKTTIFLINAVRGTAMTGGSGILCWTTVVIIQLTWHNTSRNKMTIYHARAQKTVHRFLKLLSVFRRDARSNHTWKRKEKVNFQLSKLQQ